MSQMTADEASLIPESKLRPWVTHGTLDTESTHEINQLEKALVLCCPYKIGPFQSEIDKPIDMSEVREKYGMGAMPSKADLVAELLKDKVVEMARPLGDAYSEAWLREKGVIGPDDVLEAGWDKEELPTDEMLLNPETEENLNLDEDMDLAKLIIAMNGDEILDDEALTEGGLTKQEIMMQEAAAEDIMVRMSKAEAEAEKLRLDHAALRAAELDAKNKSPSELSPRAMPQDVRRKYIDKLEKLAKAALGQSPASKYVRSKGLPISSTQRGPLPPRPARFQGRTGTAEPGFDSRKLGIEPIYTSSDLPTMANRGGAVGQRLRTAQSRGGTGQSRGGSSCGSRGGSRGGTGRPGSSSSQRSVTGSKAGRTIKLPASGALKGLGVVGAEAPTTADRVEPRPSSADPRKDADVVGNTPAAQFARARQLIKEMKKFNTTDHTWELLQTPGITKEEQKQLFMTDKQMVMNEVLEPWWGNELKYQPSLLFPEFNSKITENTKWAESALIAGIPVYQSGSMKGKSGK